MPVRSPLTYETSSRAGMLASSNPEWISRAQLPGPMEGSSEIDIAFQPRQVRGVRRSQAWIRCLDIHQPRSAKKPDRQENIDCLIEKAGDRVPVFWLLVRDEEPARAYVQLMNGYKSDPSLLARDLPHRSVETLNPVAQNLTVLLWSDFHELVCSPGIDSETNAARQELERRIVA